jgi:hypothetical protein
MMNHRAGSKYGPTLHSYVIYLLIEMRLSAQKISEHITAVFNVPLFKAMVNDMKVSMAKKYEPTYRRILEQIANGPLVHADETKGVVRGDGHYGGGRSAQYGRGRQRGARICAEDSGGCW